MPQPQKSNKLPASIAKEDDGFGIPPFTNPGTPVEPNPVLGAESISDQNTGAMVVRFHKPARKRGLNQLEGVGLKIASFSDSTESGFGALMAEKPDVLYFERFGIAIVQQSEVDKAAAAVNDSAAVASRRPEQIYYATKISQAPDQLPISVSRDFLLGFKAGVNATIDQLFNLSQLPASIQALTFDDESSFTWGLQATGVVQSKYTGAGVRIAVLDTGYNTTHVDFVGRKITAKSHVEGQEVEDGNGHGTHTLGTIFGPKQSAAGKPRYGIAHGAEMFVGKVLNDAGRGTDRSIIAGMSWALDQQCSIISMSLGGPVTPGASFNEDYEHIAQVCLDANCVVIAAAGNDSARPNLIAPVNSPANCPSILAVAAIDSDLQTAIFSAGSVNPSQAVDLCGPGVNVFSAWPGGYRRLDGTSMATPHVAGIAALLVEQNPSNLGRKLWPSLLQACKALPLPASDVGRGVIQAS